MACVRQAFRRLTRFEKALSGQPRKELRDTICAAGLGGSIVTSLPDLQ